MYQFYSYCISSNFKLSNWCRIFSINKMKVVVPKDGWAAIGSFNWTSSTTEVPAVGRFHRGKLHPPEASILRRNCMGCFIAWNSPEGLLRAKARITDMFLTDIKEIHRMCINYIHIYIYIYLIMPCSQSPKRCNVHQNTQRIIEP